MKKPNVSLITALACLMTGSYVYAQTPSSVAPDNSKSNKIDTSNTQATADAQTNKSGDIDITKRIRQNLIADKSLSTYAHNVKIVSIDGNVTLNGVVRSEDEKSAVQKKAAAVAGQSRVTNDLKIAPSK